VVEREKAIRDFKPQSYWRLRGNFGVQAGDYLGYYWQESFQKEKAKNEHDRADRLWDKAQMERILAQCQLLVGKTTVVEEQAKQQTQLSPLLYDLTSLQREANGRFGFSAKVTLSIAQALYEKHKAITYPRTDSRALPEDYLGTVKDTLQALGSPYDKHAKKIMQSQWVVPNKRIFNNAKVSDHFAIIPTPNSTIKLSEIEEKLYRLITQRFLAVFYPAAEYAVTTRITRLGEHAFKAKARFWRCLVG
jgi:DNA topoisomerase-3